MTNRRRSEDEDIHAASPLRPQEQLLLEMLPRLGGSRLLCNTAGRGQFARQYAQAYPLATVDCFFLDLYPYLRTSAEQPPLANLRWSCDTDPPEGPFDVAALAFDMRGEAELTRELMQAAHQRLCDGGRLVATTTNPDDHWLGEELQKLCRKITRHRSELGATYIATKTEPLRKVRNFACELMFRDEERLLHLKTRPGVFSHRHVDPGARRLIDALEVTAGMQVLDLGCGSGAVALAAAARCAEAQVLALDAQPRAIECVRWGAERNQLVNLQTVLNADGTAAPSERFDLVTANPPYYSHHRIAELFVTTAHRALVEDGELLIVTKDLTWYEERLPEWFGNVEAWQAKGYLVIRAYDKLDTTLNH